MSYKYTISITWTEMGQLNTYNPIYLNDKGNREDKQHLHKKTLQAFTRFQRLWVLLHNDDNGRQ